MLLLIESYTLFTNQCMQSSFQIPIFFLFFICVSFFCAIVEYLRRLKVFR